MYFHWIALRQIETFVPFAVVGDCRAWNSKHPQTRNIKRELRLMMTLIKLRQAVTFTFSVISASLCFFMRSGGCWKGDDKLHVSWSYATLAQTTLLVRASFLSLAPMKFLFILLFSSRQRKTMKNDLWSSFHRVQSRVINFLGEAIYHLANLTQSGTRSDGSRDKKTKKMLRRRFNKKNWSMNDAVFARPIRSSLLAKAYSVPHTVKHVIGDQ